MKTGAAILEKIFPKIKQKIHYAKAFGVDFVQIDICDGEYVPSKTFASTARKDSAKKLVKACKSVECELDLMINSPHKQKWLSFIKLASPQRFVIHDKNADFDTLFELAKKLGTKLGLAVHLQDSLPKIKKLLNKYPFDYVQVMGIEKVGFGGQKLSPKVFQKISQLKKAFPKLEISVDGGVKLENALKLKKAGVKRIAVGSGIFKTQNPEQTVKYFKNI